MTCGDLTEKFSINIAYPETTAFAGRARIDKLEEMFRGVGLRVQYCRPVWVAEPTRYCTYKRNALYVYSTPVTDGTKHGSTLWKYESKLLLLSKVHVLSKVLPYILYVYTYVLSRTSILPEVRKYIRPYTRAITFVLKVLFYESSKHVHVHVQYNVHVQRSYSALA